MFGQYHPLTEKTGPARIAWGLSLTQILALLFGAQLSYKMFQYVPPLPMGNMVLARAHCLIPLGVIVLLVFAREGRTGMNYGEYLFRLLSYKFRKKTYAWRR